MKEPLFDWFDKLIITIGIITIIIFIGLMI